MWIPRFRTNTPRENVENPSTFQTSFLEGSLGEHGRLSCLEHATEPSPPRSADGSSAAVTPPSGFSATGLWKDPLDCSFYPRAGGALTMLAHRSYYYYYYYFFHLWEFFSTCPVSPSVNGPLYQSVLLHTPPT